MPTIRVEETVDVARDALFAVLTDHEGYGRFPGVDKCELIRTGQAERNGLGALRRVFSGPLVLDEEIVVYDAPQAFEYLIRRARPLPVRHTHGRVEFEAIDATQTRVVWTSTFEIPLPLVGKAIGRRAAAQMTRGFSRAIHAAAALALPQAA